MDNLYQLLVIDHVDPSGTLSILMNVRVDKEYLHKYFRNNNDYQRWNVPWMCDNLIKLFDDVVNISSTIPFLQNDFQRIKYPFIFISQAFFELVTIQRNSIEAYSDYCKSSILCLYENKITIENVRVVKKKKRKKICDSNYYQRRQRCPKANQRHQIHSSHQNTLPSYKNLSSQTANAIETNLSEIIVDPDIDPDQTTSIHSIDFSYLNQNLLVENVPLPKNELEYLMDIDSEQSRNTEHQQYAINKSSQQTQTDQLELTEHSINLQGQQTSTANDSSPNNLGTHSRKRKIASIKAANRKHKKRLTKRSIQRSNKLINSLVKKLEGNVPDGPLQCIAIKYMCKTKDHLPLPLRYVVYRNKVNIPFAALTLNLELDENQDDDFNYEITMDHFKSIPEHVSISDGCIYHQCMKNALSHLSLLPGLSEEDSSHAGLVWRNTMDMIHKRSDVNLKNIRPIFDINKIQWDTFKEKMKHRVQKSSLIAHETLPDLSQTRVQQPDTAVFPKARRGNELLNIETVIEQCTSAEVSRFNTDNTGITNIPSTSKKVVLVRDNFQLNADKESYVTDRIERDRLQIFKSTTGLDGVCHGQPINAQQIISNILQKSPEKEHSLLFTDLCPIHVINRKYAISVLVEVLGLHKKRLVKLSQPCNIMEPSSIVISLNI